LNQQPDAQKEHAEIFRQSHDLRSMSNGDDGG
jgi:hypothetical protein